MSNNKRLPVGYTVQTDSGIYKMTDAGGVKVYSHNSILDNIKDKVTGLSQKYKYTTDLDEIKKVEKYKFNWKDFFFGIPLVIPVNKKINNNTVINRKLYEEEKEKIKVLQELANKKMFDSDKKDY